MGQRVCCVSRFVPEGGKRRCAWETASTWRRRTNGRNFRRDAEKDRIGGNDASSSDKSDADKDRKGGNDASSSDKSDADKDRKGAINAS